MPAPNDFCVWAEEHLIVIDEILVPFPKTFEVCNEPAKVLRLRYR